MLIPKDTTLYIHTDSSDHFDYVKALLTMQGFAEDRNALKKVEEFFAIPKSFFVYKDGTYTIEYTFVVQESLKRRSGKNPLVELIVPEPDKE